jgi:hypothetical protein
MFVYFIYLHNWHSCILDIKSLNNIKNQECPVLKKAVTHSRTIPHTISVYLSLILQPYVGQVAQLV